MSKVHDLINHERKKRGLSTVYWSRKVAQIAQSQAEYCANVGKLVHPRVLAFSGGENLAQGGNNFTPRDIVNLWLRSKAGHRENLLNPRARKAGVGIAKAKGRTYVAWDYSIEPPSYPDCPYYNQTKKSPVKTHTSKKAKTPKADRSRLAKAQRLAGRIVGLVSSILLVSLLISDVSGGAIARAWQTTILPVENLTEVILLAVVGAVALTGSILSKRKSRLGGIILIVCSVAIIPAVNNAGNWGLFGLPYLIAGILLLNSSRLVK